MYYSGTSNMVQPRNGSLQSDPYWATTALKMILSRRKDEPIRAPHLRKLLSRKSPYLLPLSPQPNPPLRKLQRRYSADPLSQPSDGRIVSECDLKANHNLSQSLGALTAFVNDTGQQLAQHYFLTQIGNTIGRDCVHTERNSFHFPSKTTNPIPNGIPQEVEWTAGEVTTAVDREEEEEKEEGEGGGRVGEEELPCPLSPLSLYDLPSTLPHLPLPATHTLIDIGGYLDSWL